MLITAVRLCYNLPTVMLKFQCSFLLFLSFFFTIFLRFVLYIRVRSIVKDECRFGSVVRAYLNTVFPKEWNKSYLNFNERDYNRNEQSYAINETS